MIVYRPFKTNNKRENEKNMSLKNKWRRQKNENIFLLHNIFLEDLQSVIMSMKCMMNIFVKTLTVKTDRNVDDDDSEL